MATGRLPFDGLTAMAVLIALTTETPSPVRQTRAGLLPELANLIDRLMSKDPRGPSAIGGGSREDRSISRHCGCGAHDRAARRQHAGVSDPISMSAASIARRGNRGNASDGREAAFESVAVADCCRVFARARGRRPGITCRTEGERRFRGGEERSPTKANGPTEGRTKTGREEEPRAEEGRR